MVSIQLQFWYILSCTTTYFNFLVIQVMGENLKMRQQVIATATIYFKRFYARLLRSFTLLFIDCQAKW